MKKLLLITFTTVAFAGSLSAQVIFDGSSDSVYKATNDNANIALTEPSNGNWVLTSTSAVANHSANVFGNFASTALSNVGDSITLGFTITGIPASTNTPLYISLSGARGAALNTTDVAYTDFQRSYGGFRVTQAINNASVAYSAWNTGFDPATPGATTTIGQNILAGTVITGMGTSTTGTGTQRFDANDTAAITMSLVRASSTEFRIDYTLNVVGGSGLQSFSSTVLAPPSVNYFQVTDSFTSFAIGFAGTMDNGAAINLSNLSVSASIVPEPTTWALLAGSLTILTVFRRRRSL